MANAKANRKVLVARFVLPWTTGIDAREGGPQHNRDVSENGDAESFFIGTDSDGSSVQLADDSAAETDVPDEPAAAEGWRLIVATINSTSEGSAINALRTTGAHAVCLQEHHVPQERIESFRLTLAEMG